MHEYLTLAGGGNAVPQCLLVNTYSVGLGSLVPIESPPVPLKNYARATPRKSPIVSKCF